MACSQFMLVAMLLVVRGERRQMDAKGYVRTTNLHRNDTENKVSTVGGSYRHHQSMGLSRTQPISAHPASSDNPEDLTQDCAGCKFIHALIRWSVASLSLPEPPIQRDLFAEDCSAHEGHQCLAIASTVPSLRCSGLKLSKGLVTFLRRGEGKKTMHDMYLDILRHTGVKLYDNIESMDQDDNDTGKWYVINPLNGSLHVPDNGIFSQTITLLFGNMELSKTSCSTFFPPKDEPINKEDEDMEAEFQFPFGNLQHLLVGDLLSDDDDLDEEGQIAHHVYNNCGRLAVVMSGKEERHFNRQKEMYHVLLQYDIDEQCIVFFSYSDEAMATWKKNNEETWAPHWYLVGEQFSTFMVELEERCRLSPDARFESVFLTYVGHGTRGQLSIDGAGGLLRKDFRGYTRVLNKMAENLFISLEACHSSSMLVEENAQFVPHGVHLTASREKLRKGEWNEVKARREFQRLFRHYPGLEERFIKNLVSFQQAYSFQQANSTPDIKFGFEGFQHDIDMDESIFNYEDTFKLAKFENAVKNINRDQIEVSGNLVTSGLSVGVDNGILGVLPLLKSAKKFKEWQAEMQTFEKHFLAKECKPAEAEKQKQRRCTIS